MREMAESIFFRASPVGRTLTRVVIETVTLHIRTGVTIVNHSLFQFPAGEIAGLVLLVPSTQIQCHN